MHLKTLILGAGAAGLHCAAFAAKSGPTWVIDHAKRAGEKIRISGGGRCNFTNIHCAPSAFISQNPHFAKSALARYGPWDFIELISRHGLTYHEKTQGQLFCDQKSTAIIQVLLDELRDAGANLKLETEVVHVQKNNEGSGHGFKVQVKTKGREQTLTCKNLVVATGGKSIPKMGATGLGYDLARSFGLAVVEPVPGLVPFTFSGALKDQMAQRSGLSLNAKVSCAGMDFEEGMLFTHRGLSGPSLLQISSYWESGQALDLNFAPGMDLTEVLLKSKREHPKRRFSQALSNILPLSVLSFVFDAELMETPLQNLRDKDLEAAAKTLHAFALNPAGTEGYRTAEVTVGGVDTAALSSQSMAVKSVPGLYFIGEVVDVTGWLGGYNFQWAWASAAAAGKAIGARAQPDLP